MKVRNGFVTNSSSSSYIIGKKDDTLTIEDVYQIVRKAYIRYYEMGQELKEFMATYTGPFALHTDEDSMVIHYKPIRKVKWEQRQADEEAFKRILSPQLVPYMYDVFPCKIAEWVNVCPTYATYMQQDNAQFFTILDYTKPTECDWVYADVSGITQISGVIQTNSATAEESAASSEELSGQANVLKDLIERLKG